MTPQTLFRTVTLAAALAAAGWGQAAQAQTPDTPPAVPPAATAPAPDAAPPMTPSAGVTNPAVTTTVTPTPEPAPESSSSASRFRIGPSVGVYLPTDSKTRDRFGSSWVSLGLGFGPFDVIKAQGQLGFDLNLQYQKHDDNHVFLLPVGLGYRIALTKDAEARAIPYAGVTGDLVFADVRSVADDVHSGFRTGAGASALLGINFGTNTNLEARYQFISRIKSFDFSGLSLTAGYRF
jgi:hypothetical protein